MQAVHLAKDGYDPFIDFMKGFCIISVVLIHAISIPGGVYTIGQCVPLFLLIQVYHCYKKGMENKPFSISKVWKRILKPFLIIQLAILFIYILFTSHSFKEIIVSVIKTGGKGAGSYYPWIYVQFALLLPPLAKVLSKLSIVKMGAIILTLSIALEVVCALQDVSEEFWRLVCFRYFFLIYLGILWCKHGLKMTFPRFCLALLSLVFITLFTYSDINWHPFFIQYWRSYHWVSYFWMAFALPILLWWLYHLLPIRIKCGMELLGKYSYEIFLCQMIVFCLPRNIFLKYFGETGGTDIFCILTILLSIVPVLIYKRLFVRK